MPEVLEVEYYRRLADGVIGREITGVRAPDSWYLKRGLSPAGIEDALVGRTVVADDRVGKLLLLELDDGPSVGLRFGMTGMLEVDDAPAIERLQYSGTRVDPVWIRFELTFGDGGTLRMRDPRRLGGVEIDPKLSALGPDVLSVGHAAFRDALADSAAPVKARLLDQSRLAGLGNLLTDEILWRASLDPARPTRSLDGREIRRLHHHVRTTLDDLLARGGSHTGDLMVARVPGSQCPRCHAPVLRRTIGGRTTYSCSRHQR